MGNNLKEFINSDMGLIDKKTPDNIDPKTSAKTTTDKSVEMSRQPYNWTIYNIKLQEKELEHSSKANEFSKNPEGFYKFLESIGESNKFDNVVAVPSLIGHGSLALSIGTTSTNILLNQNHFTMIAYPPDPGAIDVCLPSANAEGRIYIIK